MKKLFVLLMVVFFMMAGVVYSQTVDPKDLKQSDPKTPSIKTTPPPPPPAQPKEPTIKDKIEKEIKDKFESPQRNPSAPAIRGEAEPTIEIARCVQLPVACTRNSDCTCSGCCSNWGVCQPSCHSDPIREQIVAVWHGYCTSCYHSWNSATRPTKCPKCGNVAIVINQLSENIRSEEIQVAQIPEPPCVCAYCGWKCGTGHASNCIYKPKAKPEIINDLVTWNIPLGANCIEEGLQCTLHGTPCCAPFSCKGKFPNTYCQ